MWTIWTIQNKRDKISWIVQEEPHTSSLQSVIELLTHANNPICHTLQLYRPFLEKTPEQQQEIAQAFTKFQKL